MSNKSFTKTLTLAQLGILSALIIVMTFIPYVGYINYGALSITLIHIPVIIGAVVMGPKAGALLGGVWGFFGLVKALLAPPTPLEGIIFRNPLISLLPRIIVGLVAGLVYVALSNRKVRASLASAFSAIVATMTNTVLVMGGIYLLYGSSFGTELNITVLSFGGLLKYIIFAFSVNAVIEIVLSAVLTVPITGALKKSNKIS